LDARARSALLHLATPARSAPARCVRPSRRFRGSRERAGASVVRSATASNPDAAPPGSGPVLSDTSSRWYQRPAPKLAEWREANVPESLAVFALPEPQRRRLRTTNAIERLHWNCVAAPASPRCSQTRLPSSASSRRGLPRSARSGKPDASTGTRTARKNAPSTALTEEELLVLRCRPGCGSYCDPQPETWIRAAPRRSLERSPARG